MTRFGVLLIAPIVALCGGLLAVRHPPPRLIWNASASVPIGLYAVRPVTLMHRGEMVVATPPEPLASFLADRGYLPKGVPLIKPILALAGQSVCRRGRAIMVGGQPVGLGLVRDRKGRALPAWQGCRLIAPGEVFLMNSRAADSLDGRYFGPLPVTAIVGRADPLWTETER